MDFNSWKRIGLFGFGYGGSTGMELWELKGFSKLLSNSVMDRALRFQAYHQVYQRINYMDKLYSLVSAIQAKAANASAHAAILCLPGTLDAKKVKGKILACIRGLSTRVDEGVQAKLVGAVGMFLCYQL